MGILSWIGDKVFGNSAKKSSTESQTADRDSVSTVNPYAPAVPYINQLLESMNGLYANTPQVSAMEQAGYDRLTSTLEAGGGGVDAAVAANNDTLSGKYLSPDSNPYLADIAKRVSGGAMSALNATFGGKGRAGSGLHARIGAEGVGSALNTLYGGAYESERGRMQQAIGAAPGLAAGQLLGSQAQIEAGKSLSARPFDILGQQAGILGSIAGLGSTTNTTDALKTTGVSNSKGKGESNGILGNYINKIFS